MANNIRIHVTADLIAAAIPRDSSHCMIAEAVHETVPTASHISVDLQTIRFSRRDQRKRYTYLTPRIAQLALVAWDAGVRPEPFAFTLRAPQITPSGDRHIKPTLKKGSEMPASPTDTLPPLVDRPGSPGTRQEHTEEAKENMRKAALENARTRKRLRIMGKNDSASSVPGIEGGETPPMHRAPGSRVPFARRRAYGIRALEM